MLIFLTIIALFITIIIIIFIVDIIRLMLAVVKFSVLVNYQVRDVSNVWFRWPEFDQFFFDPLFDFV